MKSVNPHLKYLEDILNDVSAPVPYGTIITINAVIETLLALEESPQRNVCIRRGLEAVNACVDLNRRHEFRMLAHAFLRTATKLLRG